MNSRHPFLRASHRSNGLAAASGALARALIIRGPLVWAALLSTGCSDDSGGEASNSTTASTTADGSQTTGSGSIGTTSGTTLTGSTASSTTSGATVTTGSTGGTSTSTGTTGVTSSGGDAGGTTGAGGTSSGGTDMGGTTGAGGTSTGSSTGGVDGGVTGSTGATTGGDVPDDATIVPDPGWACGMAEGIPSPTQGELAFTITLDISAEHEVGNTPYGYRRLLDVSGGTITGDRLQGSVMTGGLEYELELSNGVMEYQSINILETGGSRIFVRSCGVAADAGSPARIIPDFEATTSGDYAFLNTGKWVATREVADGKMTLAVYDVANVTVGEPSVQITKPEGVPPQPWECNKTTGNQGDEVFTENVTLGTSFSINDAKYGSRNIIPITGGSVDGRVKGAILNGGADYQLSGSLDAWYTLAPENGELILVRNCGPGSGLIPWFEAAVDGDFDFLNTQAYLSSGPGVGAGGVTITFYERN